MQSRLSLFIVMLMTSWLVSCGGGSSGQPAGSNAGGGNIADPVIPGRTEPPAATSSPNAPQASFASSVAGSIEDHEVLFTDTSSPPASSRTWTFGDGASSTDQAPRHMFAAPGNYVVSLFVQNAYGANTISKVFPVLQAGVAVSASSEPAKEWIEAHNSVRAGTFPGIPVKPAPTPPLPALSWSQSAADIAQAYANQCKYEHNPNRNSDGVARGENIYAGAPGGNPGITPTAAVKEWAGEYANYTYATKTCSGVCGHYTQVVRRATVRVGCGQALCTSNSPFGNSTVPWEIIVCDYEDQAGYAGPSPY